MSVPSSPPSPVTPSQPELTLRAVVLGLFLSVILSAANAYLGLFAGMTVSASIPAAVLSMGLLKAVRGGILENNLVQTAASAGESAAAGAIFTLPALILLGSWQHFDLAICALLVFLGGTLGVLFTIVLRRPLVAAGSLPYPEGVATAEVLRAGHASGVEQTGRGLRLLGLGALLGGFSKFVESGLGWSRSVLETAGTTPVGTFYLGTGTAPSLLAVGHIVGLRPALLIFAGGVLNWVFVLPFVTDQECCSSALESAWTAWSQKTRYLGVGAMTVGGIGALFGVRESIAQAFSATLGALRNSPARSAESAEDLPLRGVAVSVLLSVVPLGFLFQTISGSWLVGCVLAVLVLIVGFLFSSVAAYMAGLVGSSNNPVSGVTIATILLTSLLLAAWDVRAISESVVGAAGPAAAILVGTIVCTAAAIGGDNLQDLKAGSLLGAKPARQQIMQLLGVAVASLVLGPVLQVLLDAYGFGAPTEAHPQTLRAPQATLMASVARGVFGGELPWGFVAGGAGIALVLLVVDDALRRAGSGFRVPPLAVALGLYLPWEMSGPVLLGALLGRASQGGQGLLGAAGLITGEALLGIVLAVAVATTGTNAVFQWGPRLESSLISVAILATCLAFLRMASAPWPPRPPGPSH